MIIFLQANGAGPVQIRHVYSVKGYMAKLAETQRPNEPELQLIGQLRSRKGLMARIHQALESSKIRADWYHPTPAVMAFLVADDKATPIPRTRTKRLSNSEVLQIFNLAHESDMTDAEIGAKFDVSGHAVGYVARGRVYRYLFKTEPGPEPGDYWISLADGVARDGNGQPLANRRYLMRHGHRSR